MKQSPIKYRIPPVGPFERYLLFDNKTRWRNDLICMGVALVWCVVRSLYGSAQNVQIVKEAACILVVGVVGFTVNYCIRSEKNRSFPVGFIISRRALLVQAGSAFIALFVASAPPVGAALIDEQLKRTLKAPLTNAKLEKASILVARAQKFQVRLNPNSVTQMGNQILNAGFEQPHLAPAAIKATATFASYATYLPPLQIMRGSLIHYEGQGVVEDVIALGPKDTKNGALWIRGPGTYGEGKGPSSGVPPFERIIFRIRREPYQMWLDESHIRSLTFENANFLYNGWSLKLESVQFLECHFQVIWHDDKSRENVRRFLSAVLAGGLITIDLIG